MTSKPWNGITHCASALSPRRRSAVCEKPSRKNASGSNCGWDASTGSASARASFSLQARCASKAQWTLRFFSSSSSLHSLVWQFFPSARSEISSGSAGRRPTALEQSSSRTTHIRPPWPGFFVVHSAVSDYNTKMSDENLLIKPTEKEVTDSPLERMALSATKHIGSLPSLVLHSIFFVGIFSLQWFSVSFNQIMLVLTTVVSLEAIYLAIFIQMTVNRQAHQIEEVSEDIDEIQEDVEDIQEEAKEISEDVEYIQEDVEDIKEDVEELSDESGGAEEGDGSEKMSETERKQRVEQMLEEMLREIKAIKIHAQ